MAKSRKTSLTRGVKKSTNTAPVEHLEQIGFVQWWSVKFPHWRIFAIPNGEKRSISVAKRLKAEGVKPGVPDLYVPELRLWIEMKRQRGGRVSPEQADWHDYLIGCGDAVIVGYGAQDASKKVLEFMSQRGNDVEGKGE